MSNRLATFSGKFGDILWSLATVKQLSALYEEQIDFACMPQYASLLGLISQQAYIKKAFVLGDWICTGSPFGDQPWEAPVSVSDYKSVHHLTYQSHPSPTPLSLYIAQRAGVQLPLGEPFLDVSQTQWCEIGFPVITYAFNEMHREQKIAFMTQVKQVPSFLFMDVSSFPWERAALWIKHSFAFIGCRSANYVLAHGVGQRILCYEPEVWRREVTYSYPGGSEVMCDSAEHAINQLATWRIEAKVPKL